MKIARYRLGNLTTWGIVEGDTATDIVGSPFNNLETTDRTHKLEDLVLLAPATPRNLLTAGINSESHGKNMERASYIPDSFVQKDPQVSIRNITSIVGPESQIIRYDYPDKTCEEVELVVVIGKTCKNVTGKDIFDYIFGYTVGNDVTNWGGEERREIWRAKNADTMHPIGPWIETDLNPYDVMLRARVNGNITQEESTSAYIYDVPRFIGHIVKYITLYPGDMVFMGTVGQPGEINPGDVVEVEVEGIGTLRNYVVAESNLS